VLGNGVSAKFAWQAQDLNPAGAVGNAAQADATTGHKLLSSAARGLVQLVKDIGALPANTLNG
jgi:creatinine amidohydrolase